MIRLRTHLLPSRIDIKPDNILVSFSGDIKLADLGIGVILNDEVADSAVGTQIYLAVRYT